MLAVFILNLLCDMFWFYFIFVDGGTQFYIYFFLQYTPPSIKVTDKNFRSLFWVRVRVRVRVRVDLPSLD